MDLLLSRTMALPDFTLFAADLDVIDEIADGSLSVVRRWEYALALHALRRWTTAGHTIHDLVYVVGAASPLPEIIDTCTRATVTPIDPLATLLSETCRGGTALADVVICLSLVDRIDNLDHFLYLLSCLVAPGGLLVLTMAFWNRCGVADTAQHHQLRQRIFCPKSYAALRTQLAGLHLSTFGGVDPTFHGDQCHDYTLASLVVEKRA